jgi:hypothetical protein
MLSIFSRIASLPLAASLILLMTLPGSPAQAQVPSDERAALIAFFQATGGDDWYIKSRWLGPAGTECQWYGVTCAGPAEDRYVLRLILPDNHLVGELPASLAALDRLTALLLADNQLSGSLPENLWDLPALQHLTLAGNDFEGTLPGNLLAGALTAIDLSDNRLNGYGAVPESTGTTRGFKLAGNLFDEPPPVAWRQSGAIGSLDLARNRLAGLIGLGPEDWPGLTGLSLAHNRIEALQAGQLPDLRELDLSDNQISDWALANAAVPALEALNLAANRIDTARPGELPSHPTLTGLNLSFNQIEGPWLLEPGDWPALSALRLAGNQLNGVLPEQLPEQAQLRLLDLAENGFEALPPDFEWPPGLQQLDLSGNRFSGEIPPSLMALNDLMPVSQIGSGGGLNLCWNDWEPGSEALADFIDEHHRGRNFGLCIARERTEMTPAFSGSYFDPDRDGEGINLMMLEDGSALFYWFTYTHNTGEQHWRIGQADVSGQLIDLPVLFVARGRFDFGHSRRITAHGGLRTLGHARIDALVDGGLGLLFGHQYPVILPTPPLPGSGKAELRLDYQPLSRLAGTSCDNQHPQQALSGPWYNPERDGEGFVLEVTDNGHALVYWYTYQAGASGQQAWMIGTGQFDGMELVIDPLYQPVGGGFWVDFDPDGVDRVPWGRLTLSFDDEDNGQIEYDSDLPFFGSGSYPIQRLARPLLAECNAD